MTHRIGIYPGTFDPVHEGHIAFAQQAMRDCNLDEVYFLPEPKPRNKPNATDITKRSALLEKELSNITGLKMFIPRSKRYTITETLPQITDALSDSHITMLVGSDVFRTISEWNDIGMLLNGAELAVGLRGNDTVKDMRSAVKRTNEKLGIKMSYKIIHTPETRHVSSTGIRRVKSYRE